jgi:hypothetical protein
LEIPLLDKVIEVDIEPELDVLFIRFDKLKRVETEGPLEPDVYVFTDEKRLQH